MCIQVWTHTALVLILIAQQFVSRKTTLMANIYTWMIVVILVMTHILVRVCFKNCTEMVQYVNSLFQFVERTKLYPSRWKRNLTEKMNLMYGLVAIPCIPVASILLIIVPFLNPSIKPTLIGFWLLGYTENKFVEGCLILCVLLANFWLWLLSATAAGFCICGLVPLCSLAIKDIIHAFWNFDFAVGYRSLSSKRTVRYREIQLLSNLQTEVEAGVIMPFLIFFTTGAVAATPAIFKGISCTMDNFVLIVYLSYSFFGSLVAIIFVIGGQADVWKESKRMFEDMDRSMVREIVKGIPVTRAEKKFWNSCRNLIKVNFGINNYFESITPLNCLNWAVAMSVQILLIQD